MKHIEAKRIVRLCFGIPYATFVTMIFLILWGIFGFCRWTWDLDKKNGINTIITKEAPIEIKKAWKRATK